MPSTTKWMPSQRVDAGIVIKAGAHENEANAVRREGPNGRVQFYKRDAVRVQLKSGLYRTQQYPHEVEGPWIVLFGGFLCATIVVGYRSITLALTLVRITDASRTRRN